MLTEKQLQGLLDTAKQHLRQVEGFSERDTQTGINILGEAILALWFAKLPITDRRFPAVMRVLANALEQMRDLEDK